MKKKACKIRGSLESYNICLPKGDRQKTEVKGFDTMKEAIAYYRSKGIPIEDGADHIRWTDEYGIDWNLKITNVQ